MKHNWIFNIGWWLKSLSLNILRLSLTLPPWWKNYITLHGKTIFRAACDYVSKLLNSKRLEGNKMRLINNVQVLSEQIKVLCDYLAHNLSVYFSSQQYIQYTRYYKISVQASRDLVLHRKKRQKICKIYHFQTWYKNSTNF